MAFRRNVKYLTEQRCEICKRKAARGKVVDLYSSSIPFVCDSCYSAYFREVEKAETSVPVNIRPARIHSDRYMLRHIYKSSLIGDIILWPIIGVMIWAVCGLFYLSYPTGFIAPKPLYMRLALIIYSCFTAVDLIYAVISFLRGLLRGLDTGRRITLAVKIAVYLICLAATAALAFNH